MVIRKTLPCHIGHGVNVVTVQTDESVSWPGPDTSSFFINIDGTLYMERIIDGK